MSSQLKISIGQYSDKGRKKINQDFHGVSIPEEPQLTSKGIAIALADGISSSDVGQVASQASVTGFLEDYFCTSEAWSVKKSAHQVLSATNSWLHSQTQQGQHRFNKNRGYVCTLSAMIIKSNTAHTFHLGDTRIYRLRNHSLEQLTKDHRLWVSEDKSYLSRAMGMHERLELDYKTLPIDKGDIFLLTTDGIYEFVSTNFMVDTIHAQSHNLDNAAKMIVEKAYQQGSDDNLTVQVIRIDELPTQDADEIYQQLTELPFPPILEARAAFDGYKIIRKLHASSRSHIYLAIDIDTNRQIVLKTPSVDLQGDPAYLERFLLEEWIARRMSSTHVLKPCLQIRKRNFLYIVTEFIEGQTLTQWMIDNPRPKVETVRNIVEQIAKGLRAFHRLEMVHQDLRPENIMIDSTGTVKIIDFGATKVAGIEEISSPIKHANRLGTAQYTAPEYMLGELGSSRSDLFSLGVITYQMLTGKLPYGTQVAKTTTKAEQKKLKYTAIPEGSGIPLWVDEAIRKALLPEPYKRYQEISEFIYDLRHPNKEFINKTRPPLMERDPVIFWKSISFILLIIIMLILVVR
ncbi:bifunctional protein-serine/threonine kinase/phosphatase [methanotrophic endosymbiont of Bathymodiolus puteoserpentis (Logatchev)]|jgi:serine/threonine protein phosphatase PrpC|uniref:bifunctional protein-serine/threonine kinase/phosphatase n=1 Tax=methanotrophic endosymbiont of Bathymodiolus puteoserpentis (Logatchev) TaxID=343235 RepID=UPI0013CC01F1|nr:bifunctional protein-serine/threonine kinase/phosphatase [methanotrophic endosymbiont of Bathymodiolus puteoserpentis (Logatchev)]SHE20439.1 serine/threonine protein kinase [methanotrophic endosymbiont of Bathymodiolus puteoserpentis (Logatchev)]